MIKALSNLIMGAIQGVFKISKFLIVDFLIFWLIGKVAFKAAYVTVGAFAKTFGFSARVMSNAHWIIRTIIFVVLAAGVATLATFLVSHYV